MFMFTPAFAYCLVGALAASPLAVGLFLAAAMQAVRVQETTRRGPSDEE